MYDLLYGYCLCFALALLLFFGIYFITARVPENPIYENYKRSRKIIGIALLLLSANYSVHMFLQLRFWRPDIAICMNLSTYYLSAWLFSSSLTSLLEKGYITRKRTVLHILGWLAFTAVSGTVLIAIPRGHTKLIGILVLAVWFFIYSFRLARRLVRTYRKAVKFVDDYHSEHISAYINWLSVITYWAVIYGVGCGLLTFLPEEYIFLWILSSIPFYIYLFCSYMNYLLFYEQVESILETQEEVEADETSVMTSDMKKSPTVYMSIEKNLMQWMDNNGFTRPGLTIEDLAEELYTNRTYLSGYIKSRYGTSFRDWIGGLRLDYAKKMLLEHPELTVAGVSELSGFLSLSYFTKIFTEKEECSPAKWRRNKLNSDKL